MRWQNFDFICDAYDVLARCHNCQDGQNLFVRFIHCISHEVVVRSNLPLLDSSSCSVISIGPKV